MVEFGLSAFFWGAALPENSKRSFKNAVYLTNAHPLVWENQPCNFTIAHAVAPVSVSVLLVLFLHLLPVPGEGKHEEQNSTCAKDRDVEWGFNQSTL